MFERYFTFLHETPEAGAGGDAAQETQPESEQGVELSPVMDRLDQFGDRLGPIEERLGIGEQQFADPYDETAQQQEEGFQDPYGQQQEQQVEPQQGDQQQEAIQALDQFVGERLEKAFAERLAPLQQQNMETERFIQYTALEDTYTDLQDEQVAGPLIQDALERGHAMGLTRDQALHPDRIEELYLAGRARSMAEGETPAGEQDGADVTLEGAGGASRGAAEEDPAMSIVNAGPQRLPFLGR